MRTRMADGFEHFQLTGFNDGDGLRAFDRRESFQKIFNRFAAFQGVNQINGPLTVGRAGKSISDFNEHEPGCHQRPSAEVKRRGASVVLVARTDQCDQEDRIDEQFIHVRFGVPWM